MIEEHCPHCGQRMGYRSAMSRGVTRMLRKIARAIEYKGINAINVKKELVDKGIVTVNEYTNKSHLVRLGLIFCHEGEPGNFGITRKGMGYLKGEEVPKWVAVSKATEEHGSRTTTHSEEMCKAKDFDKAGEYWEVPGFEIQEGRIIPQDVVEI